MQDDSAAGREWVEGELQRIAAERAQALTGISWLHDSGTQTFHVHYSIGARRYEVPLVIEDLVAVATDTSVQAWLSERLQRGAPNGT